MGSDGKHGALLGERLFAPRAAQKAGEGGDGGIERGALGAGDGALRLQSEPVLTEYEVALPPRKLPARQAVSSETEGAI